MTKAVEKYYSVPEVAILLSFSERWVREQVKELRFPNTVRIGDELRIPASDINNFIQERRMWFETKDRVEPGIPARSKGELRRKMGAIAEVRAILETGRSRPVE